MSERSEQELLGDLADRFGIVPDYYDNWGCQHLTSDRAKRAILAAMGLCVETADELRREVAACENDPWRRPCDPVLVLRTGENPGSWSFRLPVEESEEKGVRIHWELRDEIGRPCESGESAGPLVPVEARVVDGRRYARFEVSVPSSLAMGYYDLLAFGVTPSQVVEGTLRLILVPSRCYIAPRFREGKRIWGLSLQLYALRSSRNWGVGDFGDLAELAEWSANEVGVGVIGLSPLHALKNTRPYHISPYAPDSRLYLNVLYLNVERVPEYAECLAAQQMVADTGFRSRLEALRKSEIVDYDQVYAAKQTILEALFSTFQERHLTDTGSDLHPRTDRGRAFQQFVHEEGDALEAFALFQVLTEEMRRQYPQVWVWQDWPKPYRHPKSAAVAAFRGTHVGRLRFYQYLQWVASEQLAGVAERARASGMPIGLFHDLALANDRSGSDAWVFQDVLDLGADSGCPPDAFAPEGQNWGLPPVNPFRLRASGYQMFIDLLRKNLKYGGALRLDHVMELFRLFWIPHGLPSSAGAYVRYPAEDLLGILALESVRHQTVIVGEDLGTVPDWVRERLAASGVLSYRVFYFERTGDGTCKAPQAYPDQAVAVVTTHDLPTLTGFWGAEDIQVRGRLGLYPDDTTRRLALEERRQLKESILRALKAQGLLPDGLTEELSTVPNMTPELCHAIHLYLARTPCWMVLATLDDLLGELTQTNLPGTIDSYPNWSRKTACSLEELRKEPRLKRLAAELQALRPLA
ncbi:MAG: 4-alpha-glucanotransferase [Nitrospirae bacterium]|nr:MAG: 4-alpha-glucanotransferase [Nitrospirota bacterium]